MSITNILAWLNVLAGWSKGYFNFQTCKILHVGWSMEQRILLEKLPNHKSAWNNFPCSQNFELSKDRVILQAPSDWSLKSPARIHSPYKFFYLVPNLTSFSLPWPTTNIPRPMNPALHACSANALLPLDLRPWFHVGRGLHTCVSVYVQTGLSVSPVYIYTQKMFPYIQCFFINILNINYILLLEKKQ